MKRHLLLAVMLLLSCCPVFGQISTDEEPVSFRMHVPALQRSMKAQKTLPPLDLQALEKEDIKDGENGIPPRFGYRHEVDYTLDNSGEWTVLSDGSRIWRLTISCPNALSINLLYDKFWLPEEAKFFIYSNDHKHSIGAFTSVNNKGNEKDIQGFATGLIYGDQVTLEYWLPNDVKETGVISVAYVVHGYRYIELPESYTRNYGNSGSCNININCTQGQGWQNEKNAVAMILVNGNRYCTGSLVNTTANDNRPLLLTADHCLGGLANDYVKYDAISNSNLNHWSFYWHYESPGCTNAQPATILSTSGATVVANNSVSDFALLRLTEDPGNKTGVTPYYLGWDRTGSAGTGGVGIHHPKGDIKKISTYTMTPQSTAYLSNTVNGNENHWRVTWSSGVTEGGSSGSPLMNNSHRIIGQLHGGHSNCIPQVIDGVQYGPDKPDWYGKFSVSWTGNYAPDNRRKLHPWLDPVGTNPTTLNGKVLTPTLSGPTLVLNAGSTYTYTLSNTNGAPVTWTYSSNLQKLSSSGASATFKPLYVTYYPSPSDGPGWIQVSVGGVSSARYEVWVGRPKIYGISGETSVPIDPVNQYASVTYNAVFNYKAGIPYGAFEWILNPNTGYNSVYDPVGPLLDITFRDTGQYELSVRATNANGTGDFYETGVYVYDSSPSPSSSASSSLYQVYPNPVSDELTVSLRTQLSSTPIQSSGGSQTVVNNAYTVYLFNANGASVRQEVSQSGDQIQLDVSGLPDGIYYLLIDVGNGNKPETHKIIVKH